MGLVHRQLALKLEQQTEVPQAWLQLVLQVLFVECGVQKRAQHETSLEFTDDSQIVKPSGQFCPTKGPTSLPCDDLCILPHKPLPLKLCAPSLEGDNGQLFSSSGILLMHLSRVHPSPWAMYSSKARSARSFISAYP
ncbi:MAG: hypothetical protein DLM53_03365 [Candidatus Eremiobacter antarcticus]|nr:MAG: hypothetical protein DLM53_03365 [Candidatus Eremiobacter sp. RRmetagenome_bin22]